MHDLGSCVDPRNKLIIYRQKGLRNCLIVMLWVFYSWLNLNNNKRFSADGRIKRKKRVGEQRNVYLEKMDFILSDICYCIKTVLLPLGVRERERDVFITRIRSLSLRCQNLTHQKTPSPSPQTTLSSISLLFSFGDKSKHKKKKTKKESVS